MESDEKSRDYRGVRGRSNVGKTPFHHGPWFYFKAYRRCEGDSLFSGRVRLHERCEEFFRRRRSGPFRQDLAAALSSCHKPCPLFFWRLRDLGQGSVAFFRRPCRAAHVFSRKTSVRRDGSSLLQREVRRDYDWPLGGFFLSRSFVHGALFRGRPYRGDLLFHRHGRYLLRL